MAFVSAALSVLQAPKAPGKGAVCMRAGRKGKKRGGRSRRESNAGKSAPSPAMPAAEPLEPSAVEIAKPPVADVTQNPVVDGKKPKSVPYSPAADLPVVDESRFRLPDAPAEGVRRRRRRSAQAEKGGDDGDDVADDALTDASMGSIVGGVEDDQAAVDAVRKLTEQFRKGSEGAQGALMQEIEKDPDFLFQTGNASGEYDLTAAMIGTGRPNKQGVYVLPYLQSGHILLLLVILLCAFVYYPGFPLTELDVETTDSLKAGLALTFTVNAALSVVSYREAKKRSQPALFWTLKTSLLGGLALQELKSNAPLPGEMKKTKRPKKKSKS